MAGIGECVQVEPAFSDTKTLFEPLFATPTKIRGVAAPEEPEVRSKVTHEIPMISLQMLEPSLRIHKYQNLLVIARSVRRVRDIRS